MRNPLKSDGATNLGLLLARVPMGAFFLLAGYNKLADGGAATFAQSHMHYAPANVPAHWVGTYLHALPYLEVAIGAMLVLGLLTRLGGLIGALMVVSYTYAYTRIALKLGVADTLPFHPNLIYIGLLMLLFLSGAGRMSVDGWWFGKKGKGASA